MTIHIVLPAFNEEESLPNLLRRFAALPDSEREKMQFFVINDGSVDATKRVAEENASGLNLTVVDHPRNMGLGQAVQTGIRTAIDASKRAAQANATNSSLPASGLSDTSDAGGAVTTLDRAAATPAISDDILVIMDADDTHDPKIVAQLTAAIENGADIAIASRFVDGGNDDTAPMFRRLLSRGAAVCFKTVLPVDRQVNDFTSGFRAYRISLLDRAVDHWGYRLIEERGFACMVELLLKLRFWNPIIVEVPFQLQYNRKLGTSKIRIARTIRQYVKLAMRDRISPAPAREI
jgi:dolichol-phosphate mannosyltransferase